MTETTLGHVKTTAKPAEQQMRQWALRLETQRRVEHEKAAVGTPPRFHPFLAISREVGASTDEMAPQIAGRLGWDVLNRDLLDFMAEKYKTSRGMIEFVDETTSSWLFEVFGKWLSGRIMTQSEYVAHLGRIVVMAAHHGSVVFVGRGAQFFLPRERGVAVRVVAPLERRIERVMLSRSLDENHARKYVEQTDAARREFVRRYFHRDVADEHLYDLVVNLQYVDQDEAVELITGHCRKRFALQLD